MKLLVVLSLLAFASAGVLKLRLEKKLNPLARQNPLRANRIFNPKTKEVVTANMTMSFAAYVTNITIGTPPQTIRVAVRMDAAELLVYDSSCTDCSSFLEPPLIKFDSSKSSTYVKDGRVFRDVDYLNGFMGKDTVNLVGIGEQQIAIKGQIIGQVTESNLSPPSYAMIADGYLGLGWPAMASEGFVPPLFNAINQGLLDEPIFTLWYENEFTDLSGQLTYGGLDTDHCGDLIAYHPFSSVAHWQFRMKSIGAGGYTSSVGWEVQLYSYIRVLHGPKSIVDALVTALGGEWNEAKHKYTVDCDAKLEPIVLGIGSYKYPIDIKELEYEMQDQCSLGLFGSESGAFASMWMIGEVFGGQYCETFDIGQQRFGFAPALHK